MKYVESMIAWAPATRKPSRRRSARPGSVKVVPWPDTNGLASEYPCTVGACFTWLRELSKHKREKLLFIDFHTLTVRDGINPADAHREFLKIDEYRRLIAPDIEGAEDDFEAEEAPKPKRSDAQRPPPPPRTRRAHKRKTARARIGLRPEPKRLRRTKAAIARRAIPAWLDE